MKNLLTTILLSLLTLTVVNAQKFGHLNTQEVIQGLPEVKAADSQLESYSKELMDKGQGMMKDYEASYQAYAAQANNGEMSQLQMQQAEASLSAEMQKIKEYEVEVQNLINTKKQEVYQPILDRIQVAIDAIGKEMGYTMIFDSSSLGMVYVQESEDLMTLVKQRFGL